MVRDRWPTNRSEPRVTPAGPRRLAVPPSGTSARPLLLPAVRALAPGAVHEGLGERHQLPEARLMCGVTGFLDLRNGLRSDDMSALAQRMADAIRSRGPDGHGNWVDPGAGIALGHRRLSIVDLS